jgi:endonuclease III
LLNKYQIKTVLNILYKMYPNAKCEFNHSNNFELLISTVLSAQTTDKKVDEVTLKLFDKYNSPQKFLSLSQEELETKIKEIGLYRNKAKHILSLCRDLISKFNGEVPNTMEQLMSLAGVGRKTSNIVLSSVFNIPAIAVDTHVFRVSNRIGLAEGKNVSVVENQLMNNIPKNQWIKTHYTLIYYGRSLCKAIKPNCEECKINNLCEFYSNDIKY